MAEFLRHLLPDPVTYFAEVEGLTLVGKGKWRTAPCVFHDGSDSMRVNTETGAWVCMACGVKGGDVLAYAMHRHGMGFVEAAKGLGAYVDGGGPYRGNTAPRTLPARDAMEIVAFELLVLFIVIADIRAGVIPNDADWNRFTLGVARIDALARVFRE